MKRWIVTLAAVLALAGARTSSAQDNYPNSVVPDHRPVVLGTVVSTTSHSVTVHTNEGERMAFEVDSRTMMPRNLASGTPVRVEFHLMDAGNHHAQRITPLEANSLLGTPEQAIHRVNMPAASEGDYAYDADKKTDTDAAMASNTTESTDMNRNENTTDGSATTTEADNRLIDSQGDATVEGDRAMTANDDQLPQTASAHPWMLTIGLAALVGGLGLALGRRQRRV